MERNDPQQPPEDINTKLSEKAKIEAVTHQTYMEYIKLIQPRNKQLRRDCAKAAANKLKTTHRSLEDYEKFLEVHILAGLDRYVSQRVTHNGRPLGLDGYKALIKQNILNTGTDIRVEIITVSVDQQQTKSCVGARIVFTVPASCQEIIGYELTHPGNRVHVAQDGTQHRRPDGSFEIVEHVFYEMELENEGKIWIPEIGRTMEESRMKIVRVDSVVDKEALERNRMRRVDEAVVAQEEKEQKSLARVRIGGEYEAMMAQEEKDREALARFRMGGAYWAMMAQEEDDREALARFRIGGVYEATGAREDKEADEFGDGNPI